MYHARSSTTSDDNILSISCLDEVVRRHLCAPEIVLSYVHRELKIMMAVSEVFGKRGETAYMPEGGRSSRCMDVMI
jgi:hypothetical protein